MDPIRLQQNIRNNQEDTINFMRDLKNWTEQIKKKDEALKSFNPSKMTQGSGDGASAEATKPTSAKQLDSVERETTNQAPQPSLEVLELKESGNEALKNKLYDRAIEQYSAAMKLDPKYAILAANRGMAHLKLEQYVDAEVDCSLAISLDSQYIKAYLRRGMARLQLNKLSEAKTDYQTVLKWEPHNSQARDGLRNIELKEKPAQESSTSHKIMDSMPAATKRLQYDTVAVKSHAVPPSAFVKPAHLRSKKPLKRMTVLDVGDDVELHRFLETGSATFTAERTQAVVKRSSTELDSNSVIECVEADTEVLVSPAKKTVPDEEFKPVTARLLQECPTKLPPQPKSSFEFLRDWKLLRSFTQEQRRQYLRQISPDSYGTVFRESLDETTLAELLHVIKTHFISEVNSYLQGLSLVPRVHLLVMFLSAKQKNLLIEILNCCEAGDAKVIRSRLGL